MGFRVAVDTEVLTGPNRTLGLHGVGAARSASQDAVANGHLGHRVEAERSQLEERVYQEEGLGAPPLTGAPLLASTGSGAIMSLVRPYQA